MRTSQLSRMLHWLAGIVRDAKPERNEYMTCSERTFSVFLANANSNPSLPYPSP